MNGEAILGIMGWVRVIGSSVTTQQDMARATWSSEFSKIEDQSYLIIKSGVIEVQVFIKNTGFLVGEGKTYISAPKGSNREKCWQVLVVFYGNGRRTAILEVQELQEKQAKSTESL